MRFFDSLDSIPPDFGPSAVTFGKFDGIHIGHRQMLDALLSIAAQRRLEPTVLTFDRNPLSLLDPARCPENIVSNAQKRDLLEEVGIGTMVQVAFDRAFSAQSAEQFVTRALVDVLHAEVVLVGPDTRFGSGGGGNASTLVELGSRSGFEVVQAPAHLSEDGATVSSTRIRRLLAGGDVAGAGRLLGRLPAVRGTVVHGQQRGRQLGYPTANLSPALEGFIPADGVYAGFLSIQPDLGAGSSAETPLRRMPAAISIGNNPTFEGVPEKQVEAHVLDADLDLYDRVVVVEFVDFVRGMTRFDSLDELIAQIGLDTSRVREVLAAIPAVP